jgi:hypothetical protein
MCLTLRLAAASHYFLACLWPEPFPFSDLHFLGKWGLIYFLGEAGVVLCCIAWSPSFIYSPSFSTLSFTMCTDLLALLSPRPPAIPALPRAETLQLPWRLQRTRPFSQMQTQPEYSSVSTRSTSLCIPHPISAHAAATASEIPVPTHPIRAPSRHVGTLREAHAGGDVHPTIHTPHMRPPPCRSRCLAGRSRPGPCCMMPPRPP